MALPASHPVLSCAEAKAWEARLLADEAAEWGAMQRAGAALARAVVEDFRELGGFPPAARVLVLVGKGNNGGDAQIAVAELLRLFPGATADVVLVFDGAPLRPLAQRAWDLLRGTACASRVRVVPGARGPDFLTTAYDLCLDGIFGLQFRLPLAEPVAELLAKVNSHPRLRVRAAVDLPSGLGEENAGTVFRADFTYATGIVKAPVLREANAPWVGRLRYLDLGFFPDPAPGTDRILLPELLAPLARPRPAQSDKRSYGHLAVLGGSLNYPGAVLLTVRAALRSGVGLVTAFVPESLVPEYAARHPEAMWVGCPVNAGGSLTPAAVARIRARLERATALVAGPGLGAEVEALALVAEVVGGATGPVLLDADALRPEVVARVRDKPFVLTPHAGEWQRIRGEFPDDGRPASPAGVVVLKGPVTRVVGSTATYHSLAGGPVLARGGSGDVLAGVIGGLLAQAPGDPLLAACRGVTWHGRAADLLARARGQVAVELGEILEQLGPALSSSPWPTTPPP